MDWSKWPGWSVTVCTEKDWKTGGKGSEEECGWTYGRGYEVWRFFVWQVKDNQNSHYGGGTKQPIREHGSSSWHQPVSTITTTPCCPPAKVSTMGALNGVIMWEGWRLYMSQLHCCCQTQATPNRDQSMLSPIYGTISQGHPITTWWYFNYFHHERRSNLSWLEYVNIVHVVFLPCALGLWQHHYPKAYRVFDWHRTPHNIALQKGTHIKAKEDLQDRSSSVIFYPDEE